MHTLYQTTKSNRGYVMLFSMLITAIILSVIIGIANVSFRQRQFTQQVTQSTRAFYAAETALECLTALDDRGDFGDLLNPATTTGFPSVPATCDTTTPSTQSTAYATSSGWVYDYDFTNSGTGIEVTPDPAIPMCARAQVIKYTEYDSDGIGGQDLSPAGTPLWLHTIRVWGYNVNCTDLASYFNDINNLLLQSPISAKLVERSLSYTYITEE